MSDTTLTLVTLVITGGILGVLFGATYLIVEKPWKRPRALCSCGWHERFRSTTSAMWGLQAHLRVCKGSGTYAPWTAVQIDEAASK